MTHTRSHISKLEAFSLICQFFPQHDSHKITHLQTRGILPSLSTKKSFHNMIHTRSHISKLWGILPSLSTKLSFLNMIQTRSQISKWGAFSLVCQWVRVSSQEHVSIIAPKYWLAKSSELFKNIIAFSSFCWFGKTLNHFISLIAFEGFSLASSKRNANIFIRV
jgi:hypothetical protein